MLPSSVSSSAVADRQPWTMSRWARAGLAFLFFSAGFLFTRAHLLMNKSYLNIQLYLVGQERLPYQRRLLPMLILRALGHIPVPRRVLAVLAHSHSIFSQVVWIYLFLIDLLAVAAATYFCVKLYKAASVSNRLSLIVFPILLFTLSWTYLIHTEADCYYPYDMLSLAFFSAGLYFIYTNRFLPLVAVMFFGSLNRETTVFLVPLFLLNAAPLLFTLPRSIDWRRLPWLKALALGLIWLAIRIVLKHFYTTNDASDAYLRIRFNLRYLPPNNWPQLLGGCGFLLPLIWFLRRRIPDARIAAYMYILPLWVAVMWCWAVMMETRIYGELCPLATVATVLLLEGYLAESSLAGFLPKRENVETFTGSTTANL